MIKFIQLFKGHMNSKLSTARVMLWVLFIFMLVNEWRANGRVLYQWEFIFMGLLTYMLGGKYMFDKYVGNKKSPHSHKSAYEETKDNEQNSSG